MAETRQMKGPRGRGMHGPVGKINFKTLKRVLSYLKDYKIQLIVVFICIIINSASQVAGQLFLKKLIDDYITPLIGVENPIYIDLLKFLGLLAIIYLFGTISAFLYNRIMIYVSQGTLKKVRDDMFNHMETLPISYFDQNAHGDIMSRYTNDTDTLRELISRSLINFIQQVFNIIFFFISMLILNIPLTLVVIAGIIIMIMVIKNIATKSGNYFVKQQESLGELNGYIEEMIDGQKVIKVFTHEEEAKAEFDKLNEELCNNATKANGLGNIIGPITNNIGNVIYVIIAFVGGIIAIKTDHFTLGSIAAFLSLTRSFTHPIMQITQQLSSIVMALAGAERIFELLDEPSEENNGKVTLVQTNENEWSWKKDNELIPLKGDVRMFNVHFSYEKGK